MTRAFAGNFLPGFKAGLFALALGGLAAGAVSGSAQAEVSAAFRQAVAEAAYGSEAVAQFYRENGYQAIWTGQDEASRQRRNALLAALNETQAHGLPDRSAEVAALMQQMRDVQTTRDIGNVEAALSQALVDYATDLQTGLLVPSRIDDGMVRKKHTVDGASFLAGIRDTQPYAYMRSLVPASPQYRGLMREKLRLEQIMAAGGWGPAVNAKKLETGDQGPAVIALRNRLMLMGYLPRSATRTYDAALEKAVQSFQSDHGLETDGVAGPGTIDEINKPVSARLKSIIIAMERERWLTPDRGERHILVNQTDFTAKIVDNGDVTFETRSVIGKNTHDRRSPEFSDEMEHMVINPSWYVPRSIITKEYLPKLQSNPNAVGHIQITDRRGRVVNRGSADFSQYTARNFPFSMRQPPSSRNALGLVKFMFPNKYNIYLHDTPQKSLFAREVRAFSHGCIRLAQPFEFAYALLAKQTENPKEFFHRILNSGRETKVELEQKVPVHIIYRTAVVSGKGRAEFRRDVYGRDAKVWAALERAGVVLPSVQG
ncbi:MULTISPECIES: L,D-transpeptidase family protein [unclassified Leisingera]|uniref:L,D-transpeptidase family protein n=1 Tax=unclassified Leisingera TaxID=2614906 RepID=UPI0003733914|nr:MULTISPECIES: L,D-transpeptidase family protein [unclassified Leisingera]KIC19399.1 peptidoglycan-binding protein [Leisingera sp. ANG-DT]KIC25177.1 peptidoglycan-binding protein [Leisingera sp. ANG-S3]KIC33788.1 peptidoglycan-binding protein [Leisingera sp. ANG-S5]KIC54770.1 peptidoglycan-binding protein [Leisingera sp. ANG-S]KID10463.1 peptidoglycan-binding protein [Leisingera sp. ANG1]